MTSQAIGSSAGELPVLPSQATHRRPGVGYATWALALWITSYFYVLPLGRYSVAGMSSDFRIFDFVFLGFFATVGIPLLPRLGRLLRQRSYPRYAVLLLVLALLSLVLTYAMGGTSKLLPAGIRLFRFTAYLSTAAFTVLIVNSPLRFRFILGVLYVNALAQAVLVLAQALGFVPILWPAYWRTYGDAPTGTLSLHHKQLGVVMMLGAALSTALLANVRSWLTRLPLLGGLGLMLVAPVLSGSRTGWIGTAAMFITYALLQRFRNVGFLVWILIGLGTLGFAAGEYVAEPIEEVVQRRVIDVVDQSGIQGLYSNRTKIYFQYIPDAVMQRPWIALVGCGFENASSCIGASGAHNNYLQAWVELGFPGFLIFCALLVYILKAMQHTVELTNPRSLEGTTASVALACFAGIMMTLLVGETLWAQYSMFTLTGQVMAFVGLTTSPRWWRPEVRRP